MSTKKYSNFYSGFFLIMLILKAEAKDASSLGLTLLNIDQDYNELTTDENRYTLRVILEDGDQLNEIVELQVPGTPEEYSAVKGTSDTFHYPGISVTVTYTPDQNGFFISYKTNYREKAIGIGALKAGAG